MRVLASVVSDTLKFLFELRNLVSDAALGPVLERNPY